MDRTALFGHLPDGILTDSHIHIPGLDYPVPYEREEWFTWARRTLAQREKVAQACATDPEVRRIQRALCMQPHGIGQAYFLIMFGWIFEPREDGVEASQPWLLYPKQIELLFATDGVMQRPKGRLANMAIPKARGVGATWVMAGDSIWRWLFKPGFQDRLVSRLAELVDEVGSSDAWMWKYDYIIDRLPAFLLPKGFTNERGKGCRKDMMILNPETGAAIKGETTQQHIGVGRRSNRYMLDEVAKMPGDDFTRVWDQLRETTDHTIGISTHDIEFGTHFWDLVHGLNDWPQPTVFEMPWQSVTPRDEAWLAETRASMKPEAFHREVLMDPFKGVSTWVYPLAKMLEPDFSLGYRVDLGPVLHAMDDGYDDDFGIIYAQFDQARRELIILDGYDNSKQTLGFYGHILKGDPVGKYEWDEEALRLMAWARKHATWKGAYVGDRHGDNTDLTSGISPWEELATSFNIHVQINPHERNGLKERRRALSEVLTFTRFANTPGALKVLNAVRNNRFPKAASHAQPTAEYRKPIHNWTSHYTTALEYLAVYLMYTFALGAPVEAPASLNNGWMTSRPRDGFGRRRLPAHEREVSAWTA